MNNKWKLKYNELLLKIEEKDRENQILYSMLYETLEKQGHENVSSVIEQMTGLMLDKQSEKFKTERVLEMAVSEIVKLTDKMGDCETSCPAYEICKGLTTGDCRDMLISLFVAKAKGELNG